MLTRRADIVKTLPGELSAARLDEGELEAPPTARSHWMARLIVVMLVMVATMTFVACGEDEGAAVKQGTVPTAEAITVTEPPNSGRITGDAQAQGDQWYKDIVSKTDAVGDRWYEDK